MQVIELQDPRRIATINAEIQPIHVNIQSQETQHIRIFLISF